MNNRQQKAISALKHCGTSLYQKRATGSSAAWYVWDRNHFDIRLNLTCRDVWQMVEQNILNAADYHQHRTLL